MSNAITTYRDLKAWQQAFRLGLAVYAATGNFPSEERFGLVAQLRRSSVSIASNIAEGYGRGSASDYLRFLRMARGSVYEVETQLLFALELGFIDASRHQDVSRIGGECGQLLGGLIRSIEKHRR